MKRPHLDLENMSEFMQYFIAMILVAVYIFIIAMVAQIYGLTLLFYMVWLLVGIMLWNYYAKKVKPKDKSLLYIIAIFFSSGLITVTNLSLEELQEMVGEIPIFNYAYIKLISNLVGLAFLPIFAMELAHIGKNKDTKLRPSRYRNNRSFYKKSAIKKARRQQHPM